MTTSRRLDCMEWGILLLVLIVNILVRLPGIFYGVPIFEAADDNYVLHESVRIASFERPAVLVGLPDSTLFYSNGIALRVVFEVLKISNQTAAPNVTVAYEDLHEPWIHETARVVNLLWVITALLVFTFFTRRFFGKRTALLALVLFSASSLILEYFIEIRPDVPSIALIFGTLLTSANIAQKARRKDYVLTGILFGLSVATKYPLVLLVIPIAFAHAKASQKNLRRFFACRSLWILLGVSVATFAILAPVFFVFPSRTISQIRYEGRSQHFGADGLSFAGNLWFYLTHALNYGIGTFAAFLSLAGAVVMFKKRWRVALFLWSFPLATLIALSFHPLHWDRWMIPLLPFEALAAGWFIDTLLRTQKQTLKFIAVALFLFALAPAMWRSLIVVRSWTHPETREVAHTWVLENVPSGSRIVRSAYTPLLNDSRFTENVISTIGAQKTEFYMEQQVDYFIVNNAELERFFTDTATPEQHKAYARKTLENSVLIFETKVPPSQLPRNLISVSDWHVFQNGFLPKPQNGDSILIHAFSAKAKDLYD